MKRTFDAIKEIIHRPINAIDKLVEISIWHSNIHKEMIPTIHYDLIKYHPELYKKTMTIRDKQIYKYLKENIEQGIKEGLYRDDLNVDVVANLYIKKIEDIMDPDFLPGKTIPVNKIFSVMFDGHIRSIANAKGLAYFEKRKDMMNIKLL